MQLKHPTYRIGQKRQRSRKGAFAAFVCLLAFGTLVGATALEERRTQPAGDSFRLPALSRQLQAEAYAPAHIPGEASAIQRPARPEQNALLEAFGSTTLNEPLASTATASLNFTHTNIVTTLFWVGETESGDNGGISNVPSAWDSQWQTHFGGVDTPDRRNGWYPAGFTPRENPFYAALPYSDLDDNGDRKASAINCPRRNPTNRFSWCKNSWLAIRKNGKIAYAQWQDAGPFDEDDTAYVFGRALPRNTQGVRAGLDVSPAVNDYLGLSDVDRADWIFVAPGAVPPGPWKNIVTSSTGDNAAN